MKIVIDIDAVDYEYIKHGCIIPIKIDNHIYNAIRSGILLPKGHGDIIDRNKIEYMKAIHDMKWGKITAKECATKIRNSAPTIIEADTESEE